MPRRVVVVATAPDPEDELRERVRERLGDDTEVFVIAPASDLSILEWLTSDEDRARAEAQHRAEVAAAAAPGRPAHVGAGDADPLVALDDALRTFPADEIVLVTRPDETRSWLEEDALHPLIERFGLPITHLVDDDAHLTEPSRRARRVPAFVREIARGESPWTAFLVQNVVAITVGAATLMLVALVVAVYYSVR
ncbi:MAG: hypothetical protein ACXVRJ_12185 [Gaiellaceae bacterium]